MTTTENLALSEFVEGQKGAATKLNTNQDILDSIIQLWLIDGTPPTTPPVSGVANGHAYIVPASATGDWSGQDNNVAIWRSGWTFHVPMPGLRAWDTANFRLTIYLGDRWQAFQATRVAEITDSTGGSDAGDLVDVGLSYDQSALNDNFATLHAWVKALMDALILSQQMAADSQTEVVDENVGITEVNVDDVNPA